MKLLLLESQIDFIARLSELFKKKTFPYVEITRNDNLILKFKESRNFLANLGMNGEIISTPGHTDDSITLILDEGFAFTGDLQPRFMLPEEDRVSHESWDKIYRHKITRIFPGHGG
jgi:hypothetical protein